MSEPALPEQAVEALHQGRKIDAIKLLREAHGLGLKEAKDAVEQYARIHGISQPDRARIGLFWPLFALVCISLGVYLVQRFTS